MTGDQCSQADVCSTYAPPKASSSSSGDEGCIRSRRWSVYGGQKDGAYEFFKVSFSMCQFARFTWTYYPALEISSNEARFSTTVHVSSMPISVRILLPTHDKGGRSTEWRI